MSTTAPETPTKKTVRNYALGRPTADGVAAQVLAAVWCRSVGSAWTLELREFGRDTLLGSTVDWITSGIPISQPEPPEELTRELLAEHDQHLFSDSSARPLYSQSARPWLRVQKR